MGDDMETVFWHWLAAFARLTMLVGLLTMVVEEAGMSLL